MRRLGFLGPPGTFGEQAALTFDPAAEQVALPSNGSVVEAVRDGRVDLGVAPIENSLEGAVNETLDALLRAEVVSIQAELVVPVEHNLIAATNVRMEDVQVVMSHPQALAQCRAFLESRLPNARLEAALSTSAAVAAAVQASGAAAVGTRRAAELNGAALLAASIQDVQQNKTRFVVVAPEDARPSGDDKTSFAFTVAHDRPGTLIGVLQELSIRDINLTHIESRPSREELGIYVFLIEFQGHRREDAVADALAAIEARSHYFRILGSYPRFQEASD